MGRNKGGLDEGRVYSHKNMGDVLVKNDNGMVGDGGRGGVI